MYTDVSMCVYSRLVTQYRLVFICAWEFCWESLREAAVRWAEVDLWFGWVGGC